VLVTVILWIEYIDCGLYVSCPDSYLGNLGFKSRPGDWLSWQRFLWFSLVPPVKCQNNYLISWSSILEKLIVTQSRNSPAFMEPKGSLPCSQEPTVPILSQMHPVRTFLPCLPKLYSHNIIFPSTLRSGKWFFSSGFPTKILDTFLMYATCPAHPVLDFYHPNNIWWSLQVMKVLILHSTHPPTTSSLSNVNILLNTLRKQIEVFYVVTPCSVVVGYSCFGGPFCLHLQGSVNFHWCENLKSHPQNSNLK
jgi:hypothetical protein